MACRTSVEALEIARPRTFRRTRGFQASAHTGLRRWSQREHSFGHMFELLPKHFELSDSMLNGRNLLPNQREKPRTERCPPCAVENAREHTEPLKRQPQRAGSTDKVQPLHGRLAVLAVA